MLDYGGAHAVRDSDDPSGDGPVSVHVRSISS
jgi:hypothetical protein